MYDTIIQGEVKLVCVSSENNKYKGYKAITQFKIDMTREEINKIAEDYTNKNLTKLDIIRKEQVTEAFIAGAILACDNLQKLKYAYWWDGVLTVLTVDTIFTINADYVLRNVMSDAGVTIEEAEYIKSNNNIVKNNTIIMMTIESYIAELKARKQKKNEKRNKIQK